MSLVTDDINRLIGRLEAGFEAVIDRVNRSDDATAEKFRELGAQHEKDKNLAISAREAKHAENLSRFQGLDEKVTTTYGLATVAYQWVTSKAPLLTDQVEKIDTRVKAIEDGTKLVAAEERGAAKTWGYIVAVGSAIGTVLTGIITAASAYWGEILDFIAGKH